MATSKVSIDSDIFFFCFESDRSDIKPSNVRRLLQHICAAPNTKAFASLSVIGESTIECLVGEQTGHSQHDVNKLHDLIDFWGALGLKFLYPNELVVDACSRLIERYRRGSYRDFRLSDTDLIHLGYAIAYDMDYFLTTDKALGHYIPAKSDLEVIGLEGAKNLF